MLPNGHVHHVYAMRRRTWVLRVLLAVGAVAVLTAAVFVAIWARRPSGGTHGSDTNASIRAADGSTLSALVISPSGSGPFPLLVLPASWGAPASEYRTIGRTFADAGYAVVAYAQRGFRGSGGTIDFAGAATQRDVSTVIDWALKHTHTDSKHIGMFGTSYGGGIALLAAARDARIRAVVAASTWTDLAGALAPQGAYSAQGLDWLLDKPAVKPKLSSQLHRILDDRAHRPLTAGRAFMSMAPDRSAARRLRALNRNRPAIMLVNAFQDSLLDPTPLVSFYGGLRAPKRLELLTGEHGGPEYAALDGTSDGVSSDITKWFDRYLRGRANGIDRGNQVLLQDGTTGAMRSYPQWPAGTRALRLGTPDVAGTLGTSSGSTWSRELQSGTDSAASVGGPPLGANGTYHPLTISVDSVQPAHAFIWTNRPTSAAELVSGLPTLRLHVAASAPKVTLYAYLYDVDPSGTATIMSYAPATVAPGSVSMALRPLCWTVAAGNHLELVVDTVDSRFVSAEPKGTTVTLSAPASLALPTR